MKALFPLPMIMALALLLPASAAGQKRTPVKRQADTVTLLPVKPIRIDTAEERRMRAGSPTLTGTVRDAQTGEPMHANVIPEVGWEFAGPDGRFTVHYLQPGRQTVRVEQRGFIAETRTVELVPGQTTTLDVSLRRAPPPCCVLDGKWHVRFVLRSRSLVGPEPRDSAVEGLLTFADSVPDPLHDRFPPPTNVRVENGLSDVDFTPFFGGRIARDVSTTVMGATGGNFAREMVGQVFNGDSVEITLIPRISHGGVSMWGRISGGVVTGEWEQRAYAGGATGTFEMRREGPERD
jgi:hypothetical protein